MGEDARGEQVPEDIWAKFQEDSWGRIDATAPKEPSARARMVTERLRQEGAAAPGETRRRRPRSRPRWMRWQGGLRPWVIGLSAFAGFLALCALVAQIPLHWIF
ncbi:hypothetical protein AB0M28_01180 [Streptomyces sp. NPDC051940]|uniref:hypothetical protein n=1 Tax=Streptomyces sp. NPDC051940 TaxID=3155675 RepID=UPI00343D3DC8